MSSVFDSSIGAVASCTFVLGYAFLGLRLFKSSAYDAVSWLRSVANLNSTMAVMVQWLRKLRWASGSSEVIGYPYGSVHYSGIIQRGP